MLKKFQLNRKVMLLVGAGVALLVLYAVFTNKHGFPCNCQKCQEAAVIDAINKADFPQIGGENSPSFVPILYTIFVLFVVAAVLAFVMRKTSSVRGRVRSQLRRLPYAKRLGV